MGCGTIAKLRFARQASLHSDFDHCLQTDQALVYIDYSIRELLRSAGELLDLIGKLEYVEEKVLPACYQFRSST